MKILLTGHKGYIGSVAGPMLTSAGHEVIGLDTDLYAGCDFGEASPEIPGVRKDIRNLTRADLEAFDAVVHLAALSNDPLSDLDPALTCDINHKASVRLASLAKQAGVKRFVFSSSCSTYGAAGAAFLAVQSELIVVGGAAFGMFEAVRQEEQPPLEIDGLDLLAPKLIGNGDHGEAEVAFGQFHAPEQFLPHLLKARPGQRRRRRTRRPRGASLPGRWNRRSGRRHRW